MCGIAGVIGPDPERYLHRLKQNLQHRGPDATGIYSDTTTGLIHTRLSIIDPTPEANQPLEFGDLVIVYNGEIYNYKEIKVELRNKGYTFSTDSDTEVLLKGFHLWGSDVLDKLIGMFAFAIYNKTSKMLFLARDRMGVKPLYYGSHNGSFYFASELKALQRIGVCENIDNQALGEYLLFGFFPSSSTIFSNFNKLSPGHYLTYKAGAVEKQSYWKIEDLAMDPLEDLGDEKMADQLEELLISSFKYRMVSDVPVGMFFSGGIDSSLVLAILSRHYGKQNTFTIGFEEDEFNEIPYARKIAKFFDANHSESILDLSKAKNQLSRFYSIYDDPFHDASGIPTSLVSKIAREKGYKVVLSAEGGDELFSGYPSYTKYFDQGRNTFGANKLQKQILRSSGRLANFAFRSFGNSLLEDKYERLESFLDSKSWSDFYLSAITSISGNKMESIVEGFKYNPGLLTIPQKTSHPIETFMLWDLKYLMPNDFLQKVDRATMYYGVEGREPLLDHKLIEFAVRLPYHFKQRNGDSKFLLKKVLSRYLPKSYYERPKMGFGIPLFTWFKRDIDRNINSKLNKEIFSKYWPQIKYSWVEDEKKKYFRSKKIGRQDNVLLIWKLLHLVLWREAYSS